MRAPGSISRATVLNNPSPTAPQRTDPTKSEVSAAGNAASMSRDVCPFGPRGRSTKSSSTPSRSNSQRTNSELDSRLWMANSVLIPPSRRRTGKMASPTGVPAPTTAMPTWGRSKRSIPPMGPSETTFTDPLTSVPRPWVEIVSTPSGSISVRTVSPPFS